MSKKGSCPGSILPACPICGDNTRSILRFVKDIYHIYRCEACSGCFVFPQPSSEALASLYDENYFKRGNKYISTIQDNRPGPAQQNDLSKIRLVQRYRTSGCLLDVGCAMGGFLHTAKNQGYEVAGIEISESAANYVQQHLGIDVKNCDLPSANLPAESWDIITLWDVIEHLREPHSTLAEVYRLLRPGGIVFVSTGDAASRWARFTGRYWQLLTPPQHLFFYTPQSLAHIFERNRLAIHEILYPGKDVSLEFMLFKAHETFGRIISPIRRFMSALGLNELRLYVNLHDIMTVVAMKPGDSS